MKPSDPVRRIEFCYLDGDLSAPLLATRSVIGAKARRMSFFLTSAQVRARAKTVTRRAVGTWTTLRPGDRLVAIEKGQCLKAGEKHTVLALLEVVSVRVEQLDAITTEDCAREGRRDERLHLYNSGGGPPYVNGFCDPGVHGRLWMLDGESVSDGGKTNPNRDGPIGSRRAPALSDADLLAMGIERTTEHPGDIFADASDEPTTYCEACDDEIPRHANPCEHHCGATYKSEGDEEDRCPDCNTSQRECDDCGECGGETCISCGRNVCSSCWPGHVAEGDDPCERGAADWQEPE